MSDADPQEHAYSSRKVALFGDPIPVEGMERTFSFIGARDKEKDTATVRPGDVMHVEVPKRIKKDGVVIARVVMFGRLTEDESNTVFHRPFSSLSALSEPEQKKWLEDNGDTMLDIQSDEFATKVDTFLSEFASERQSSSGPNGRSGNAKRKTPPVANEDKSGDEGDEEDDVYAPQSDRPVLTAAQQRQKATQQEKEMKEKERALRASKEEKERAEKEKRRKEDKEEKERKAAREQAAADEAELAAASAAEKAAAMEAKMKKAESVRDEKERQEVARKASAAVEASVGTAKAAAGAAGEAGGAAGPVAGEVGQHLPPYEPYMQQFPPFNYETHTNRGPSQGVMLYPMQHPWSTSVPAPSPPPESIGGYMYGSGMQPSPAWHRGMNNPVFGAGPGHNSSMLALWWGSEQLDRERAAESERANRERASEASRIRFVQMMMMGNNQLF